MSDLTEGRRIYAIGDVHGMRDLLDDMLLRVRRDLVRRPHPEPLIVMLGDYADRGPDSRGVIDALIGLRDGDLPAVFLLGNHDSYIPAYLEDPDWFDRTFHWLHPSMGGAETLASYGVVDANHYAPEDTRDAFSRAFPAEHAAFIADCVLWHRVGGYLFAHAGIRPAVPVEAQARDDLIWIREPFLSSTHDHGFKVVHGHTIVPMVEHHPNRIAVDTGAVRTGVLSCLVLEGGTASLLEPDGLRPWPQGSGTGLSRVGSTLRAGLRSALGGRPGR